MKRFKIVTLAAVAVLGLGALGGAAVRANASDTNSTPPAADQATTAEPATGQPDGDNIQQGDQTTADTEAEAAGEQAGSEVPGNDGPGGHADEPGNANADHQFEGVE